MAGVPEGLISDLVAKGVERIASRKKLTSQDLTVLLIHQQSGSMARMEKGVAEIARELRDMRVEVVPFLNQANYIPEIKQMERTEAKVS